MRLNCETNECCLSSLHRIYHELSPAIPERCLRNVNPGLRQNELANEGERTEKQVKHQSGSF